MVEDLRPLNDVPPGHVGGVPGGTLSQYWIALSVHVVVDALQTRGEQEVLGAAERCGEPIENAQQLFNAIRAGLFQRGGVEESATQEVRRLAAVVAGKGLIGRALKGGFWRSPCCHMLVHWFPHKHHCSTHLPGAHQS